jgi:hypothetical protein
MKKKIVIFIILTFLFSGFINSCFIPEPVPSSSNNESDDEEDGDNDDDGVNDNNTGVYEPNDNYGEATLIQSNITQTHTIYKLKDIDFIRFNCIAGRIYRIVMSQINGFEPEMNLYDTDGKTLLEMKNVKGGHTDIFDWFGHDTNGNYNADEKESIIFTATKSGYYFVSVNDTYNIYSSGSYKITVYEKIEVASTNTLTATPNMGNLSIDLHWSKIANATGYRIYRSTVDQALENYNLLTTINNDLATSYSDNNIIFNTKYYYYIVGFNGGNTGNASNVASASLDIIVGDTLLQATSNSQDFQIDIIWTMIDNAQGYYLYRTTQPQNINNPDYNDFTKIATITSNSTIKYVDKDIQPNITYYYYITGYNNNVEGNPSNVDDAMFDWGNFKPTSALINASEGLSGRITVTLNKKYDNSNIVRYEIYRSPDQITPVYTYINSFSGNAPVGSSVDDTDVTVNQYYFYCVKIIIDIGGVETSSQYSWFDSGVADN